MTHYAKRFFGQQGIIKDGLKLWLDASNPISYPGTGTLWSDLSGNGNNGTMLNGVAYSTANGGVMSFDGVNDAVNFPNTLVVSNTTGHTICFWIKRGNKSGYQGIATLKNGTDSNVLLLSSNKNDYSLSYGRIGATKSLTTTLTINQWYHITCTMLNNIVYIYVNAIFETNTYSPTYGGFNENNKFGYYASAYFLGQINDTLIYNRALTQAEITNNFNATRSKYGI